MRENILYERDKQSAREEERELRYLYLSRLAEGENHLNCT